MVNQQLLDYIKQQIKQNMNQEQIKSLLMTNGWQEADINEAFVSINFPIPPTSPNNITDQKFSTISQQPEQKINKILLMIFSILGILIIGISAFGYFFYLRETPEKVIEKMTNHLTEIKTFEYQGEIKAEITTPDLLNEDNFMQTAQQTNNNKVSNFSIKFNGKSDISDLNNTKILSLFHIKTNFLKELIQGELAFDLEVRAINKVIYIKLNNSPNLGFFDLNFLSNKWININTEEIIKQFGLENFEEQIKGEQELQKLTPKKVKKRNQLLIEQTNAIKITKKLTSEKIEGMDTYHYKYSIDKNKLKKLIIDNTKDIQNKTLTDKELNEIDKVFKAIKTFNGEIWIGKKDYLPYKIFITIGIKEMEKSKTTEQITITLLYNNYNKPVQIDVPSPVNSIEEIFSQLFGGFENGMQLPESQQNLQLPLR